MNVEINEVSDGADVLMMDGLHLTPLEQDTLCKCLSRSMHVYYGRVDNTLICIWGVIPASLMSDQGYIWLYASEEVKNHQFVFIRKSQIALEKLLKQYNCLVGYTNVDSEDTKKWLKWLGATFGHPIGKAIPFSIRKK